MSPPIDTHRKQTHKGSPEKTPRPGSPGKSSRSGGPGKSSRSGSPDTASKTVTPSTEIEADVTIEHSPLDISSKEEKSEEKAGQQDLSKETGKEDSETDQQSGGSSDSAQSFGSKEDHCMEIADGIDGVDNVAYGTPSTIGVHMSSSVDDTTTDEQKHLWKPVSRKNLKIIIPKSKAGSSELHKSKQNQESKSNFSNISYIDDNCESDEEARNNAHEGPSRELKNSVKSEDKIVSCSVQKVEASKQDSSDSAKSQGSHTNLLEKKDQPISNFKSSIPDLPTAVVQLMAIRKLTRDREPNNNQGVNDQRPQTSGEQDKAETEDSQARRRWRMVLDVKKFESVVREPQTPEKINKELMFGGHSPKHRFVSNYMIVVKCVCYL